MPELPDVEGFRRVLAERGGRRIEDVVVRDAQVLREVSTARLRRTLSGRRFGEPRRLGKWLLAPVEGGPETLVLHFGMTGALVFDAGEPHRHDRVLFRFRDGDLRFRDMRKLQGLRLAADEDALAGILGGTGPDAMSVSKARFREALPPRRQIKAALTDQACVSGLGNLLADEILWRARTHPRTRVADADLDRVHARMRTTVRAAMTAGRVPPRPSWLTGRRDEPSGSCPRCGTRLSHGRAGGRGTVWCPYCQPG